MGETGLTRDLDWTPHDGSIHWLVADYYRIERGHQGEYWLRLRQTNGIFKTLGRHADIGAAKAAGQDHFEARIRASLKEGSSTCWE